MTRIVRTFPVDVHRFICAGPESCFGRPHRRCGAYSGVERIDGGQNSSLIVMTAAFGGPFELCQTTLTGVGIGCTSDLGKRYFDLAFDGRYLYGAAFFAGTIDKIDLTMDAVSTLVPEPNAMFLVIAGLLVFSLAGWRHIVPTARPDPWCLLISRQPD